MTTLRGRGTTSELEDGHEEPSMGAGVLAHSHPGLLDNQNCVFNSQRLATDRYQCCHGTGRHMGDAQLFPSRCTSDARTTVIDDLSSPHHLSYDGVPLTSLESHSIRRSICPFFSVTSAYACLCLSQRGGKPLFRVLLLLPTHPTASLLGRTLLSTRP
ncbi:hypothetical protein EDC04DRAFT_1014808 [Pisolithus marmoratus]|nr:hypothetical protein EDC04DRAFT_1014808 [Pisolithus marmoratus]